MIPLYFLTFPVLTYTIQTSQKLTAETRVYFPDTSSKFDPNNLENTVNFPDIFLKPDPNDVVYSVPHIRGPGNPILSSKNQNTGGSEVDSFQNVAYDAMIPVLDRSHYDVHPILDISGNPAHNHRSARILTKSFFGEGTSRGCDKHGTKCARQWRQIVLNARQKSGSKQVPSILLSTVDRNGTQSIIYCQNYQHFLRSLTVAATSPTGNGKRDVLSSGNERNGPLHKTSHIRRPQVSTKGLNDKSTTGDSTTDTYSTTGSSNSTEGMIMAVTSLIQALPRKSSVVVFTTDVPAERESTWMYKLETLAKEKSSKVNIFSCQEKSPTEFNGKNPWHILAEKTKGKFVNMDDTNFELGTEEDILVVKQNASGSLRIPIQIDSSTTQLHFTISGTVQKAILHTSADYSAEPIDLFALQSHHAEMPSPAYSSSSPLSAGHLASRPRPWQGQPPPVSEGELNVYLPVNRGTGTKVWTLETRGIAYDLSVGTVRNHGNQDNNNDRPEIDATDVNISRFEPSKRSSQESGLAIKQDRIDTNLDQSESRVDQFGESQSRRNTGPDTDRILNVPEWHLGPPGAFGDRPWYLPSFQADLNGDSFHQMFTNGPHNAPNQQFPISPIQLEVNQASSLTALPGETVQIQFDLTNNWQRPIRFYLVAKDQFQYVRSVYPPTRTVDAFDSARITVVVEAQGAEGTTDVVSLTAFGLEPINRNVYLHIGREIYDNTKPDISYTWKGDCENALTPDTCMRASWGIEAVVQDTESGLLKVISKPFPLRFRSNFVAGTRETVKVQYISSCCFLKVDLIATDVKGNVNKYTIDVENRWLSWSQIMAIVFGSILLIIVLVLIVFAIARCIRTRRTESFLRE
ncbi:hypothetical protein WDU94_013605 [Cyamophila willieti]